MKRTPLWIGGKFLEPSGGEYFDDYNPSDQSLIAKVAKGTPEDIDTAVAAAREAFLTFSQSQAKEREAILSRAAALVERDRDEYLQLLVDEFRRKSFASNQICLLNAASASYDLRQVC